jgi:hypothetical protein
LCQNLEAEYLKLGPFNDEDSSLFVSFFIILHHTPDMTIVKYESLKAPVKYTNNK